jgi:glutaredoxin 2
MKLYVYDHCPYCVKARMIFGYKAVPFKLVTLPNDDEETPVRMIGKKMVPILEKDDGACMPESLDIIAYVDQRDGAPIVGESFGDASRRLAALLERAGDFVYPLAMPRWVQAPLPEFATPEARSYFIRKKEKMIGEFGACLSRSDALIAQANRWLEEMDGLIKGAEAVHGIGGVTYDDFHLFAALRSLSVVKGVEYPANTDAYRRAVSARTGVPLHDGIAL